MATFRARKPSPTPVFPSNFKKADKNGDGKLSRAEYLEAMTKQDAKTAKKKVSNAAAGSSAADRRQAGGDKIGKDAKDPGFNKLDKNGDGHLSRLEAAGNPSLAKNFKQVDKNGDGKLSRAEYLEAMTKQDLATAKRKVEQRDRQEGRQGTTRPAPARPRSN